MANRAIKKAVYRDKYFTQIVYEYRGREYEVEYPNGHQICCTPAHIQHRDAQARIDKALDEPVATKASEQFDINAIWDMMGW